MAGPPSLEEAVGGLAQQRAKLVPQRLGQVGVDLRGAQARMAEQDLDDPDVHAPLEHVRGEAVTQRVRSRRAGGSSVAGWERATAGCGGFSRPRGASGGSTRSAAEYAPCFACR